MILRFSLIKYPYPQSKKEIWHWHILLTSLAITAGITIAAIITAGAFAPAIAVALVGSNFAGLLHSELQNYFDSLESGLQNSLSSRYHSFAKDGHAA